MLLFIIFLLFIIKYLMLEVIFSIIIVYMHTHNLEPNIIYSIIYSIYSNSIPEYLTQSYGKNIGVGIRVSVF